MRCWSLLILIMITRPLLAQLPVIEFTVEPDSAWVGDNVNVKWSVRNANRVFISHIGDVSSSGIYSFEPTNSLTFLIVAENSIGIVSKTRNLELRGTRGIKEPPGIAKFTYSKGYEINPRSFTNFLSCIWAVLQDSLNHVIPSHRPYKDFQRDRYMIVTSIEPQSYLLQARNEPRISARRIAYLVEFEEPKLPNQKFMYFVKIFIEYRRVIEEKWREETDRSFYDLGLNEFNKYFEQAYAKIGGN